MVDIAWDGLIQGRQIGIDQKVVVPGVSFVGTRRRYTHAMETEMNGGLFANRRAIRNVDKVDRST
jgi:hypothetical protein